MKRMTLAALLIGYSLATAVFPGEARAQFRGPGIYNITVAQTGDALDVDISWSRGGNAGQPLLRWGRHNGTNQTFVVLPDGNGFIIRALHSLQCLDVSGASSAVGTSLVQFPCHGGLNQRFFISTGATTVIRTAHADRYLFAGTSGRPVVLAAPPAVLPVGMVFVFNPI